MTILYFKVSQEALNVECKLVLSTKWLSIDYQSPEVTPNCSCHLTQTTEPGSSILTAIEKREDPLHAEREQALPASLFLG